MKELRGYTQVRSDVYAKEYLAGRMVAIKVEYKTAVDADIYTSCINSRYNKLNTPVLELLTKLASTFEVDNTCSEDTLTTYYVKYHSPARIKKTGFIQATSGGGYSINENEKESDYEAHIKLIDKMENDEINRRLWDERENDEVQTWELDTDLPY
jgi:hypothetical protein